MPKKLIWVAAGLALVLVALVLVAWNRKRSDANELIAAYTRAACVPPHVKEASAREPVRAWDQTFDLGSGVSAKIDAACSMSASVTAKYSDEPAVRTVARPGDYLYPCDLRIDWMQMRLYVRADGLSGGVSQRTELYEYDLQARQSPRTAVVEPGGLPPRCDIDWSK